jgi:hypothetical protein
VIQIGPILLGIGESELHPAFDEVLRDRFELIINVGANLGYYALGLALRYPEARVIAFDTDSWARRMMREMISLNELSNVEVRSYCSPEWLAENLRERSLVVSDCEGFEGELFFSVPIPNLTSATLVIETHDDISPGVTDRLRRLLAPTHQVTEIRSGAHPRVSPVDLGFLDENERFMATQEVRNGEQGWLFAVPIGKPQTSSARV